MKKKLTKKQRGFLKDYEATGNATEAVRRNYKVTSYGAARAIGSENLTKPNITAVLEKDVVEAEVDRKWVLKGTKELAEQREEKSVALGAYKLIAQIIKIIDSNATQPTALLTDNGTRAEEARRITEALTSLVSSHGGRFAILVEPRSTGVRSHNGTSAQASNGVHPDVEQA